MKIYKFLSALLIAVMMSCCLFIFANAEQYSLPDEITEAPITEAPSEEPSIQPTSNYAQITSAPVATEPSRTTLPISTTIATRQTEMDRDDDVRQTYQNNYVTEENDDEDYSKVTRSVPLTTTTKPTTVAKNYNDYGKKFVVAKWIAFVIMLLSAGALIAINVRHYNQKKKQKMRRQTRSAGSVAQGRTQGRGNSRRTDRPDQNSRRNSSRK